MAPTINPGDVVFADPTFYKHSAVSRGDIVVVIDPDGKMNDNGQPEMYIKRVVALGHDKIQVVGAKVYVNGQLVSGVLGSGRYASDFPAEDFGPVVVPSNTFFVMGDNLPNSFDSRHWKHPIQFEKLYGKVTTVKDGKTGMVRYV